MSGSLRLVDAKTPPKPHEHWDLVLDSGKALRFHDPRRFGSLIWTKEEPGMHPLLKKLAPEPLERRIQRRVPVPRHAQARGRDQAAHHELATGRRRREYLRQRGAFSRGNFAAARGPPADTGGGAQVIARPSRRCSRPPSKSAARRCAITSTPTACRDIFARNYLSTSAPESRAACANRPSGSSPKASDRLIGAPSASAERRAMAAAQIAASKPAPRPRRADPTLPRLFRWRNPT